MPLRVVKKLNAQLDKLEHLADDVKSVNLPAVLKKKKAEKVEKSTASRVLQEHTG